jgi:hypothetical protein
LYWAPSSREICSGSADSIDGYALLLKGHWRAQGDESSPSVSPSQHPRDREDETFVGELEQGGRSSIPDTGGDRLENEIDDGMGVDVAPSDAQHCSKADASAVQTKTTKEADVEREFDAPRATSFLTNEIDALDYDVQMRGGHLRATREDVEPRNDTLTRMREDIRRLLVAVEQVSINDLAKAPDIMAFKKLTWDDNAGVEAKDLHTNILELANQLANKVQSLFYQNT